ncbi:RNA polymerase subunit sigma-70 [Rathayibacter soli]|uniref:RNA polymerase subunit sigma-70 n=1 Tax=Rathayibacter soli TaxID=3144168 RepID=UPI0027E4EC8E|nr:RNA polymerase subunit sigma-70 [Glaciibacter superstes]
MSSLAAEMVETAEPYRRELLAYCYRMTGSLHDAQDLVQETMIRAWRSAHTYDLERGSVRTWLYGIATNQCLNTLSNARHRVLPVDLSEPSIVANLVGMKPNREVPWLEPFPGSAGHPADPAAVVEAQESIRLAFIAALQHLAPLQRAVLILRDVLAFSAADSATLLGTTPAAINSALQRAHDKLDHVAPAEDSSGELTEAEKRNFLDRYVTAFETHDIDALTRLLREDVLLQMPPQPAWFAGRDQASAFLARSFAHGGRYHLVPTTANGCPAFAMYRKLGAPAFELLNLQVLTLAPGGVARIDAFQGSELFAAFELPERLPEQF